MLKIWNSYVKILLILFDLKMCELLICVNILLSYFFVLDYCYIVVNCS